MFSRLLSGLFLGALLAPPVSAQLELPPSISRSSWTSAEGLPQNSVSGISQDVAGYLWIATYGGLARFDGRHFEVFDVVSRSDLPGNRFSRVFHSRDGTLWVWVQEVGLFAYREDRFTRCDSPGELRQIAQAGRGRIWGTFTLGLGRIHDDRAELVREGAFRALLPVEDGVLWLSTLDGELLRYEDGEEALFGPDAGLPPNPMQALVLRDGILWGGCQAGVWRSTDSTHTAFERVEGAPGRVRSMALDERSALWFGCRDRLVRWEPDARSGTEIARGDFTTFLNDARGNLWAGSLGDGLHCLRYAALHDVFVALGLPADDCWVITEEPEEAVFILCGGTLYEIRDGEVVDWKLGENLPSALVDREGVLWVGTASGLARVHQGGLIRHEVDPGSCGPVRALLESRDGSFWVGSVGGLYRRDGGRFEPVFPGELAGVRCLLEDPSAGALWVGGQEGLARIEGESVTRFTAEHGLPPGTVRALHLDPEGVLWAGTYGGGLCRIEDGTITRYSRENGLADNYLSCILEDDDERLWINSNSGPFVVHRRELNRVASGQADRVACTSFTRAEGAREANGGSQPAGWRTADGRMWFPTIVGVTVADPGDLPLDEESPTVLIEALEVGESRELDVRFAALDFSSHERVRIQYRLIGNEAGWIENEGDRRVHYSYLPPGDYEFQVRARNGYGPWTEVVSESFEIAPRFHERTAFLVGIAVVLGLGALGLAELRLRRSRARTAELLLLVEQRERAERSLSRSQVALRRLSRKLLASQEMERRRISCELHDDVTQRLAALAIQAEVLEARLERGSAPIHGQLREIVEKTQELAGDVQQLSRRLHPVGLRTLGLTEAVRQECDAFTRRSGIGIELDEDVVSDEVSEDVAVAAFRILQESLHNIEKHARAGAVGVVLRMEEDQLVLAVADSGSGFELENGTDAGLGLVTMRERAATVGGRLSIASRPGEGTTVRLCAPGKRET